MDRKGFDTDIILAQWQTCVEMANAISKRRDSMNNIFITINMAIFTTISFSQNLKSAIIIIAGIMVCILWIFLINSYKLLNEEKYKVIIELESYLPKEPFHDEWERLKNNSKYNITTKIERFLAMGFIIVYVVLGILVFKNK